MLRERNIALVVAARFISRFGGVAVHFVGVWGMAAYVFDATPSQLAAVMAGASVAGIIGSMVAGVAIDRFGPRRVLIVAELLSIPAAIVIGFAPTYQIFAIEVAIFAAVGFPTFTAGASFAPYLVTGRARLEKANALIEAAGSLAFVLGPAAGAVIATTWGVENVFWLMVPAASAAALCAHLVKIDERPRAHVERHPLIEFREGLKVSYGIRSLRYYILLGTLAWFSFGAFSALEPLFYRDVVGVGVEWIGYMNTGFGVGLVAGAWLMPRLPDRVVSARGAAVVTALLGLGAIGYVGTTLLPVIAVGAVTWGLIIGLAEPLLRTLMHVDAPHEYVGRVVSTSQYHRTAGELIPLAVAPWLATLFGVQAVLIGGGVIVACLALGSLGTAAAIDAAKRRAESPVRESGQEPLASA